MKNNRSRIFPYPLHFQRIRSVQIESAWVNALTILLRNWRGEVPENFSAKSLLCELRPKNSGWISDETHLQGHHPSRCDMGALNREHLRSQCDLAA